MFTTFKKIVLPTLVLLACSFSSAAHSIEDSQKFSDWTARCGDAEAAQQTCVLEQIVYSKDGSRPMLRAAAGFLQEEQGKPVPAILITVPLMVALQEGIAISVDAKGAFVAPYHHCNPEGCVAGLPLDEKVLSSFKAGTSATIRMAVVSGEVIELPLSLLGFTAGYKALPKP